MSDTFDDKVRKQIAQAQFIMLRYETEFTPCTGITAVAKQERRNFHRGIMIAPWCPRLVDGKGVSVASVWIAKEKVGGTGWAFDVNGKQCTVYATTDDFAPIIFLEIDGCFQGIKTPYDVDLPTLKADTLYFGLAVKQVLEAVASPPQQFVWGADWETVPALHLVRDRHHIALTLHNTFDECLEGESKVFGDVYNAFSETGESSKAVSKLIHGFGARSGLSNLLPFRWSAKSSGSRPVNQIGIRSTGAKTALEIGIEIADVVTTVNRGFAYGMRTEPIQKNVMAKHLQHLLGKVVGINNAAFSDVSPWVKLKEMLLDDFAAGRNELFRIQTDARAKLPGEIKNNVSDKVLVVSMGRRVSQKQHDVLVESARQILDGDKNFPVFIVFATVDGDTGSPARLERMKKLQEQFPSNVFCIDDRISYYATLMAAADYNCMPSLYEPHGGAYEGTVIPIARAIDGLAEQICALDPRGEAATMNAKWHSQNETPTGFLFREQAASDSSQLTKDLEALLKESPSPENGVFTAMRDSLSAVLREAVCLRKDRPDDYARLVLAAIEKQEGLSWHENLGGMIALIEEARIKREIAYR